MNGWFFYLLLYYLVIVCIEEKLDLDLNYDENGFKNLMKLILKIYLCRIFEK